LLHFNLLPFYVETVNGIIGNTNIQNWLQSFSVPLISAYWLVVLFKVANALRQRHLLHSYYNKQLQKPSIEVRLFTRNKAYQFGIFKKVDIWLSHRVHTPLTFGFWKPIILLPVALVNQLSTAETEALIIHELTHIKAKDYLLNWLLMGVESFYFFNPFIRIIAQKIRLEREKNCDVQVLQFEYSNIVYAESLLKTAQFKQEILSLQLAAFQNKPQLFKRIQFFTDPQNLRFGPAPQKRGIAAMMMIPFIVFGMLWISNFQFATSTNPSLAATTSKNNYVALASTDELVSFSTAAIQEYPVINKTERNKTSTKNKTTTPADIQPSKRIEKISIEEENLVTVSSEDNEMHAIAVSDVETITEEEKQIVINEENSTGKKITTAYRVVTINGQYYLEPLWMLKDEPKPIRDSLLLKSVPAKKDTVIVLIPTVQ
jgi:beta-lactamase regulating signal transducer with metallopeptidase domain